MEILTSEGFVILMNNSKHKNMVTACVIYIMYLMLCIVGQYTLVVSNLSFGVANLRFEFNIMEESGFSAYYGVTIVLNRHADL